MLAPDDPTWIRLKLSVSKLIKYFDLNGEIGEPLDPARKLLDAAQAPLLVDREDELHRAVRKLRSVLHDLERERESDAVVRPER
jgi:hypothetical protein